MSLMQLPPTRPPRRSVFGQDPGLSSNYNGVERRQSLLAVQPRRVRRPQLASRWDSTFDIFIDPFEAQEAQNQEATFSRASLASTHQVAARDAAATDDAMAQASKREFLGETTGNAANTQKKRTSLNSVQSVVVEEPPHSPVVVISQPMLNADRAARRRTIYVPPEDTTIMTIHPGAPSRRIADQGRPPRRSDVFLDLATLSESGILEEGQGTNKAATPSDRKRSMAVLPKRGPLRQCARPLQGSAFEIDIPGSGGGKENIPPMYRMDHKKGKAALASSTSSPKLDSKPPITSTYQKPIAIAWQYASAAMGHNANVDHSTPVRTNRLKMHNYASPSAAVSPKVARNRPLQSLSPTTISASSRVFSRPERTPSKLSVPLLSHHFVASPKQYQVLTEHVSNTDLYEEQWLNHQEAAITGLINELFDGSTTRLNAAPISYGSMRTRLMQLYDTEDVAQLHKRLHASLRFGALSISGETLSRVGRFKDDIGQSRAILDLWLKTYDPAILQAAAEVVIGREIGFSTIHTSPNFKSSTTPPKKSKALDGFLLSCLLRNEDVTSAGTALSISGADGNFDTDVGGLAWSWRRTVTRSLLIILVIDKAASSGTINKCVFQASSLHKSSVSVLQALMNFLLPSIGAVIRVLGRLSYHLSHVQYPLQEYNYTIQNLATDLRDGIRLTRLIEILLYPAITDSKQADNETATLHFTLPIQPKSPPRVTSSATPDHNWPLSQHLKYPCTSRVQKLYNVRIALEALRGAKSTNTIVDSIEPQDIVDGYRERTVSLLWSLVGRWGLSLLVDFDALVIEINRLKRKWCRSCIRSGKLPNTAQGISDSQRETDLLGLTASHLDSHIALLLSWSCYVGKFHNVDIQNLSTSFADGHPYQAIVDEYAQYLPAASPQQVHHSRSSATSTMQTDLHSTLRNFGCSNSFIALFPATSSMSLSASYTPSIPSKQTTIPLLAFLASRLLPAARPTIAAIKLQQWWRGLQRVNNAKQVWGALPGLTRREETKMSTGEVWKQRGVKARLARECREVVVMRARIERASIVLQRWWRKGGLAGQSMRSRRKG